MYQQTQASTGFQGVERRAYTRPPHAEKPVSAKVISALLPILDAVALFVSAMIAYALAFGKDHYDTVPDYALAVAFGTLLALNVFKAVGLYEPDSLNRPRTTFKRIFGGWMIVAAGLLAIGFLTQTSEDYSRKWAILWMVAALTSLLFVRFLFHFQTARWMAQGRLNQKVAIVGAGPLAERLAAHFNANQKAGVLVAGIYTDEERPGRRRGGRPTLDDLIARLRRDSISTVIVAVPKFSKRRLGRIFERLSEVPVDVRLCPGQVAVELSNRGVANFAGVPTLNVMNKPLDEWRCAVKEVEDRILGTLILALIAPVMLAVAVLIKLDSPGPVFFKQKRYGYNNKLIGVLKFRTMRHDMSDHRAEQLTQRDDPRVTRLGVFLRRTSLDELPQFINVLRGEMSIVGPRPHAVSAKAGGYLYQEAVPRYASRHRVKPGITGWAQINGWRGTTDTIRQIQQRVDHDLYYIENWSLWLDIKIIFLTIFKGFSGQNAY